LLCKYVITSDQNKIRDSGPSKKSDFHQDEKIIVCVFDMRSLEDQTGTNQHYDDTAIPKHVALYSNTKVAFD